MSRPRGLGWLRGSSLALLAPQPASAARPGGFGRLRGSSLALLAPRPASAARRGGLGWLRGSSLALLAPRPASAARRGGLGWLRGSSVALLAPRPASAARRGGLGWLRGSSRGAPRTSASVGRATGRALVGFEARRWRSSHLGQRRPRDGAGFGSGLRGSSVALPRSSATRRPRDGAGSARLRGSSLVRLAPQPASAADCPSSRSRSWTALRRESAGRASYSPRISASFFSRRQPEIRFSNANACSMESNSAFQTSTTGRRRRVNLAPSRAVVVLPQPGVEVPGAADVVAVVTASDDVDEGHRPSVRQGLPASVDLSSSCARRDRSRDLWTAPGLLRLRGSSLALLAPQPPLRNSVDCVAGRVSYCPVAVRGEDESSQPGRPAIDGGDRHDPVPDHRAQRPRGLRRASLEEMQPMFEATDRFNNKVRDAGHLGVRRRARARRRWPPSSTASGDEAIMTDGPYLETKEWIGGFWILDAPRPGRGAAVGHRGLRRRAAARSRCVPSRPSPDVADGLRRTGPPAIERIYREEYGRIIASLVRRFGDIDIAEEAAGEALLAARRAVAARRRTAQPRRVADDHGRQPGDRPAPARVAPRRQAPGGAT